MEYSIMRELNVNEIKEVNGGDALTGFNWGVALGTVGGAVITGASIGATRFGIVGGALGFAAGAGYGTASALGAKGLGTRMGSWMYNKFSKR